MDYDIIACQTLEASTCSMCIKIKDLDVRLFPVSHQESDSMH